jgi:hypothetical protein
MTTEERLEKLEMELARVKEGRENIVTANAFSLVDKSGNRRASLSVFTGAPTLNLADENGKLRASLAVLKNGPSLDLFDENHKARAGLLVGKDGPALTCSTRTARAALG